MESSNRDVQDLTSRLNTLKGRLEECSDKYDSLSGEYKLLEKKTAVLHASLEGKSALEAKVNRLEEALNKGLAKDSASAAKFEELEAKLASASEKVSTLETAWLPFWLQEKFDRIIALVQPAVSALVRQVGPHVRHASKAARHTWNHTVQPYVFRQFKIVMSHGAEVWGYIRSRYDAVGASIWEKMPPVVQTFAVQSRHAMLWVIRIGKPAIMKGMDDIKRNLIIALSEIEKLVVIVAKQYPATLGWASDASFGIAVFVLSTYFCIRVILENAVHDKLIIEKQRKLNLRWYRRSPVCRFPSGSCWPPHVGRETKKCRGKKRTWCKIQVDEAEKAQQETLKEEYEH